LVDPGSTKMLIQEHPSKQIWVLGTLVFGSQNVPRTFP